MGLIIENLFKSFGDKKILQDFSYTFNDSGVYIISGESGVGKTTLLRIICGLDKNYSGRVYGGGFNNVSVCFQEYRLFDALNALENITEVSFKKTEEADIKKSKDILSRLKFSDSDMLLYPRELSGGMKQRISFARAVLKDSPILILDEPTKEVDAEISTIMRDIIRTEAKERTVLLVTHKDDDVSQLAAIRIELSARH